MFQHYNLYKEITFLLRLFVSCILCHFCCFKWSLRWIDCHVFL